MKRKEKYDGIERKEKLCGLLSYRALCEAAASSESIGNFWLCCVFPRADLPTPIFDTSFKNSPLPETLHALLLLF